MHPHTSRFTFLKKIGFKPRNILDIGAYKGLWALNAKDAFPDANMFMIEANEDHKESLIKTGFEYVIALLGNEELDSVDYYKTKHDDSTGNSIFKEQTKHFSSDNSEIEKLPMKKLDNVIKENNWSDFDFIKLDVQGSEINVLQGSMDTIKNTEFILLEVQLTDYNLNSPKFCNVAGFMDKINYRAFDLFYLHYLPSGHLNEIDILFIRKDSPFIKNLTYP